MESEIGKMVGEIRGKRESLKITKAQRKKFKNPFYRKSMEVNKAIKSGKRKGKKRVVKRGRRRVPKLQLQAIFENRVKISGRWYRVGDFVKKQKIVKIEDSGIELKFRGKIYRLNFNSSRDKKISFEVN
jgi:hypothetical protein